MIEKILKPLWSYRGFILGSVKREFQSKYRNSLLGVAWTVINPLASTPETPAVTEIPAVTGKPVASAKHTSRKGVIDTLEQETIDAEQHAIFFKQQYSSTRKSGIVALW